MIRKKGSPEKIEKVDQVGTKLFMKTASCRTCHRDISLASHTWSHGPVRCPQCGELTHI